MQCTVFQCIPAYKPLPALRIIRSVLKYRCRVLIDLEDSIQDVINAAATPLLKQQARADLLKICSSMPGTGFDVRVNALNTHEYICDRALLKMIGNISSVFIPKAAS